MKINEVELTIGMTKKNIRFYEQEGLLTPSRSPRNGYRDYSADDVNTLRQIKLLRKLGISIEDIKKLQDDSLSLEDCLRGHLVTLEQERKNLDAVTKFCRRLLTKDITFDNMPTEQLLADIENIEKGGTSFMNTKNQENKGFPFKVVIPAVIAAALLFMMLAFFVGRNSVPMDRMSPNAVLYSFYETGDFFYNLKGEVYESTDQVRTYWWNHSADSSLIAYWLYEEDSNYPSGIRTDLHCITGDLEPVKVAESVGQYMVSYDGSYIAYFQDTENSFYHDLYLYEVSSGLSTKIDEEVTGAYFCLSPNGKIVAYQKEYGALFVGGIDMEVSKVAEDDIRPSGVLPVAVSDDGAYLYYIFNGDLYYYNANEKESVPVASNIDPLNIYAHFFCFNRDLSEMIYVVDFETYYYTPELEAPVKIADDRLYHVLEGGTAAENYFCSTYAEIASVDTLKGHVLEGYMSRLYWLDEDAANAVEIATDYNEHILSADGKSLLYLESGVLYRLDGFGEEMTPTIVCEKGDIQYFTASSDLSKIYISTARDLYYVHNSGELEQLSDNLAYVEYEDYGYYEYYPVYDNTSGKIYFLEDGALYEADKTENSKYKAAENVEQLDLLPGGISYLCNENEQPVRYYLYNGEITKLFAE
ncbi:MAG: MerR family transcriptional regulator [Lachnospiraceae bacterium]|nr:MerR family transcriptional regulator [Lachnospiraceae bacterium]